MASTGLLHPSRKHAGVRQRRLLKWKRGIPLYAMLLPTIAYFMLFTYYPLVHSVVISMQDFNLIGNRPFIGLENYRNVLTDPTFWADFRNTLFLGISML
ncbi:carbohydrate ABC transporter permease, partial [Alicyclobacillus fodiniaquatilis]